MPHGSGTVFYNSPFWKYLIKPVDRLIRIFFVLFVQLYQYTLSWLLGGQCRFYPTCSDYALDALLKKPIWKSLPMIVWRVMRCNPLCKGGHEEVPNEPSDEFTSFEWPRRERRTPY